MATGSLGCMTLQLPRTNQMWNGGSTELQMTRATGQSLEPSSYQSDLHQCLKMVRLLFGFVDLVKNSGGCLFIG